MRDEAVVGCTGSVVLEIGGSDDPGEVFVSVRGGGEPFLAYSSERLAVGTPVLVIDTRGERTVDVIAWQPPLLVPPG